MKPTVLIAEDDEDMASLLAELCSEAGLEATLAPDGGTAVRRLHTEPPDVLLTDLRLPAPDGMALLAEARAVDPAMPVVMITGYATVQNAIQAFRSGLYDLITKPFDNEQVAALLGRIVSLLSHRRRIAQLTAQLERCDAERSAPVVVSRKSREVLRLAQQVAPLDMPVLISGETGTGKGVLARHIHALSPRADAPYFAINCAAIPENLIENELFGHEKGAYTGAAERKRGLLELADGGTLLLDEINTTSPEVQARLLQFVQEKSLMRVGGERSIQVDVRLVVAANEELAALVEEGRFRRDLYYRLNVFPIPLPPLRERREDIPELAEAFLLDAAQRFSRPAREFSAAALEALQRYAWPGNIRELENILQRAVVLAEGEVIGLEHLPAELGERVAGLPQGNLAVAEDASLAEVELYWIRHMIERCGGNKTEAARRLGVDPSTLHRRLKD
ncbi:MAG: sigma-54-dependent transcriptional regulator [Pseudomonadota bacterium]